MLDSNMCSPYGQPPKGRNGLIGAFFQGELASVRAVQQSLDVMPPRKEHPGKGWAAALDRISLIRTDINQDSSENQQRLNRQTARDYGLKIKPGYDFSERGTPASKAITRRELARGINAVVEEK